MDMKRLSEILAEMTRTQREILDCVRQIVEIHEQRVEEKERRDEMFRWPGGPGEAA